MNLIHISIDRNHAALCGSCCSCDHVKPIFQDRQTGLPAVTCPKCIELNDSPDGLLRKIKNGKL